MTRCVGGATAFIETAGRSTRLYRYQRVWIRERDHLKIEVEEKEISSENAEMENKRRKSGMTELHESDENGAPSIEKSRSESEKRSMNCDDLQLSIHELDKTAPSNPQCILCETYPLTVRGYVYHLYQQHKLTLIMSGCYLICACEYEIRTHHSSAQHSKDCAGLQFTLHKLVEKIPTTPQCIMCEAHPSTAGGYDGHLEKLHKSSLHAQGMYLICSCGMEVRSKKSFRKKHSKECDGREFTLHKLNEKIHTTPQCVICEAYPSTAYGYAKHMSVRHDFSLESIGIYKKKRGCSFSAGDSTVRSNHYKQV
ncbi:hypothetical protein PENTCL1PPCAC_1886, partial [Pristionchus entomophagus]